LPYTSTNLICKVSFPVQITKIKPLFKPHKSTTSPSQDSKRGAQADLLVRSITGDGAGSLTRKTEGTTARAGRGLGFIGTNGGTGVGFSVLLANVAERNPAARGPLLLS
jgi:hypothetical protein